MSVPLTLEQFEAQLRTDWLGKAQGWRNEVWESIDSTNTRAATLAGEGAPAGMLVMARQQTHGRGRLGRSWLSPPDAGLFMSLILRPDRPPSELQLLTLSCGVAVAEAIEAASGVKAGLKWVNDIVVDGRKLGGILAEMPDRRQGATPSQPVIIGLGINIDYKDVVLPEELEYKIGWINEHAEDPVDPNTLAATIAESLESTADMLFSGDAQRDAQAQILDRWRAKSVTMGARIRTEYGGATIEGKAVDIADTGALIVEKADGERILLHAGEISIRNADGSYC